MFHKRHTLDHLLTNGDLVFEFFNGIQKEYIFKTEGQLLENGKVIYNFASVKVIELEDDFKFIFQKDGRNHLTTKNLDCGVRLL